MAVYTANTGVFWTNGTKSWRFTEWRPQTETKQQSGEKNSEPGIPNREKQVEVKSKNSEHEGRGGGGFVK